MKQVCGILCILLVMILYILPVWAFPTTSVLDTFNRADENPLGNGTWSGPVSVGESRSRILTNQVVGTGTDNSDYWSSATFGANSEVFITIAAIGTASGNYSGVFVRIITPNTAGVDGYQVTVDYNTSFNRVRIYSLINGTFTQLGADITQAFSNGDGLGLEAIGSGTNNLTAYRRSASVWSSLGQRSDATITSAGNIGITEGNTTLDDFGGGTVVSSVCGRLLLMGVGC